VAIRVTTSAFRIGAETVEQDWDRLAGWLSVQGLTLDREITPKQFSGGLANLNYLISVDGVPTVLRRPPAGPAAEGANDMAREARVLGRLSDHYPLAPRSIAFCDDVTVLGAQFQLVEYRDGTSIGAHLPAEISGRAEAPEALTAELINAMAALHSLDPAAVGLDDLGRPEGFLGRQVEGWSRRGDAAYDGHPPPALGEIVKRLRDSVPTESAVSLLHGDLKFDNLLFDLVRLVPVAVVDWDMATRGDPLFDLAVLLSYWVEPTDPAELHALDQVPSLGPGFPSRASVVARYFAAVGREPVDLSFHLALARLRLAVAWQQLYQRYERGAFSDPRYASFAPMARSILSWTADTLEKDA
jgi:aminoglycoside phosphotransferase (APT) family kinase protein